jgi:hypothetical protein
VHGIRLALRDVGFTDGRLAHLLLVHELPRSVDRAFGTGACPHGRPGDMPAGGPGFGGPGGPVPPGAPHASGPYAPGPYSPGPYGTGPYGPPGPGFPGGPGMPPPEPPRRRRNWFMGCLAATGLCCSCRLCCASEYEGPWSGRKREGCCRDCDCGDCGDCCQCCQCCQCCDCGGCDCGGCDCGGC